MIITRTKNFDFVYNNLFNKKKTRYIILQGGTRSGKTYATLQALILYAFIHPKKRIHIIAITIPHIRNGAMADFKKILQDTGVYKIVKENKRDLEFIFPNKSSIKFYSADKPQKMRGLQKDIVFINEANLISGEAFNEIDVRTSEKVILDFNPTSKFWLHDFIKNIDDTKWDFLVTTYKDNPFLSDMQIKSIEARKSDPVFWSAYGEGLLSKPTGLIIKNFMFGDFQDTGKTIIGLDFGYTDPTAGVLVSMNGKNVFVKEIFKRSFLSADDICSLLEPYKEYPIISDNNDPRLIKHLSTKGFKIKPTKKGKNSIQTGLSIVNSYNIVVDKSSNNLWTELINYRYSNTTNLFAKADDHLIDAMRYAIVHLHSSGSRGVLIGVI